MQTTIPEQMNWRQAGWQALRDLDFLSAFFSWFFMLLTRLSEPLMLLATLYVVAETGVPAIATPALHNLAIGIMITAPEIILPGAFVVASRSQEHARTLFGICWAFVILTAVTLVSLFVWHLTGQALAWLMCARCAAAVGYSILMRVMNHSKKVEQVVQVVPDLRAQLLEQVAKKVEEMQGALVAKMQGLEKVIEQQMLSNRTPEPATVAPVSEQFGDFTSAHYRTPPSYAGSVDFAFQEFGLVQEQSTETTPTEQSEEREIEQREPAPEQRLRIVKTVKKPVRKVKKERGNAVELVTGVLQANPRATLSEIVSQTGVSRGHASTLRTQILNKQA